MTKAIQPLILIGAIVLYSISLIALGWAGTGAVSLWFVDSRQMQGWPENGWIAAGVAAASMILAFYLYRVWRQEEGPLFAELRFRRRKPGGQVHVRFVGLCQRD